MQEKHNKKVAIKSITPESLQSRGCLHALLSAELQSR